MKSFAPILRQRHLVAIAALGALLWSGPAMARVMVIPHILESSGRITTTPYTYDTSIFANYVGGVACVGGGQQDLPIDLYLYEDSGVPMRGLDGTVVCNPCATTIGASHRKVAINVESLFAGSGGLQGVVTGFGILVIGGADPDNVAVQGFVVNSHTGPFDLAVFGFDPVPINVALKAIDRPADKSGAALPCGRVFTAGHLLVTGGVAPNTPYTFDTTMFMTYVGGLAGQPSGGGATVDVYLFDEATGQSLGDAVGTPACYPCTVSLDDANRKNAFSVGGHLPGGAVISAAVSAVCVVSGDADKVAIQSFVVNTHTGPFDVSMYGPPLKEITASAVSNVPADLAERLGLRSYPNPFNPRTTFAYTLPAEGQVQVRVFDAQGALVRTLLTDNQSAGSHEVAWDGAGDDGLASPSGVYFGRIESAGVSDVQKVVLLK
jgi:hypothetical protein